MKKFVKAFLSISLALTTFVLASCSQPNGSSGGSSSGIDDYLNAEPITFETLCGTWSPIYQDNTWPLESITFIAPNSFSGVHRDRNYGTMYGTFTLEGDKLTIDPDIDYARDFKAIYKDNKLYLAPYATNDVIKDAYDLYGSHFPSVEEFIKANCEAIYVKQ